MKKILLICFAFIALFTVTYSTTYAYWTTVNEVSDNVITTSKIGLTINGSGSDCIRPFKIKTHLYPSNVHSETRFLMLGNIGDLPLKYQINFSLGESDELNKEIFDNVIVGHYINRKIVWKPMSEIVFEGTVLPRKSTSILIKFRLNPAVTNIELMDYHTFFNVVATGIQLEDTF